MNVQQLTEQLRRHLGGFQPVFASAHTGTGWPSWDDAASRLEDEKPSTTGHGDNQELDPSSVDDGAGEDASSTDGSPENADDSTGGRAGGTLTDRINEVLEFVDQPARPRRRPLVLAIAAFLVATAMLAAGVIPELRDGLAEDPATTTEPGLVAPDDETNGSS